MRNAIKNFLASELCYFLYTILVALRNCLIVCIVPLLWLVPSDWVDAIVSGFLFLVLFTIFAFFILFIFYKELSFLDLLYLLLGGVISQDKNRMKNKRLIFIRKLSTRSFLFVAVGLWVVLFATIALYNKFH
ncbi:hypothetical protein [Helicobacter turcicus]|uniref:Uncharacterized protein n=1 Tax=Helicobacter turcicus TaxID=2867412 RepID=A0ABS7JKR0_9HELI|nr:hypothetical protein [Helicobacter turcicus]MBX7489980.1 hypothetical protein [Helicobacter turcicus]MBX7544839.1 hypothetical protein [Helicobacter turcicus]